jgi:hypothetical protein
MSSEPAIHGCPHARLARRRDRSGGRPLHGCVDAARKKSAGRRTARRRNGRVLADRPKRASVARRSAIRWGSLRADLAAVRRHAAGHDSGDDAASRATPRRAMAALRRGSLGVGSLDDLRAERDSQPFAGVATSAIAPARHAADPATRQRVIRSLRLAAQSTRLIASFRRTYGGPARQAAIGRSGSIKWPCLSTEQGHTTAQNAIRSSSRGASGPVNTSHDLQCNAGLGLS